MSDAQSPDISFNGRLAATDFFGRIRQWASDRNLINGSDAKSQFVKLMSEVGELASAIDAMWPDKFSKENVDAVRDGIGDCAVMLTIIAEQLPNKPATPMFNNDMLRANPIYFNGLFDRWPHFESVFFKFIGNLGLLGDAIAKNQTDAYARLGSCMASLMYIAQCGAQPGQLRPGSAPQLADDANVNEAFINCLDAACDDIKDRTGVMYNGVFVKSSDPRYSEVVAELEASKAATSA